MKRVVVFGATGNLGAYISLHMKSQGYDVIAVGHRKDDNNFFADRGMRYYSVDIKKPEAFDILPKAGGRQTVPNQHLGRVVTVYYNESVPDCVWIQGFYEALFPAGIALSAGICLLLLKLLRMY